MSGALITASNQLTADHHAVTSPAPDNPGTDIRAQATQVFHGGLGGIDYLFSHGLGAVTDLAKGTDSRPGLHGGLIPSSFQHVGSPGVSVVDGQDPMTVPEQVLQSATPFADAIKGAVLRLRGTVARQA